MQTIPVPGSELSLGPKNPTVGWSKPLTYLVCGFVTDSVLVLCALNSNVCSHSAQEIPGLQLFPECAVLLFP